MAGVDLNVIDMTADPPKVLEVSTMPAVAPVPAPIRSRGPKPVWVDNSHVRFEGVSPQPGDNPNTKQLLADRRRHGRMGMLIAGEEEP